MITITSALRLLTALFGLYLFSLNIAGLILPFNNHSAHLKQPPGFNTQPFTNNQVQTIINKQYPSTEDTVTAYTELIHRNIAHFWPDENLDHYGIRIPWRENYLLRLIAYIRPDLYGKYEFCDYKKTLERGVGLCSQQALALTRLLNEKEIQTHTVGLNGHVVTTALIDFHNNTWWVADPDYGVVLRHSLDELQINPSLASSAYSSKGYDSHTLAFIRSVYQSPDNTVYPRGVEGYPDCPHAKIIFRKASYWMIWLIPLLFITPTIFNRLKHANNTTHHHQP